MNKYHGDMYEYGSMVIIKLPGKLQGGLMRECWVEGVWLGKRWSTDEHIVSLPEGRAVRARDVRPLPDERAFDLAVFDPIKGTPSNPSGAVQEDPGAFRDVSRAPVARPEDPVTPPIARRTLIHRKYLERFGYTTDCKKCREILRGDETPLGHSEFCRKRIEGEMAKDVELKKRLAVVQKRRDQ